MTRLPGKARRTRSPRSSSKPGELVGYYIAPSHDFTQYTRDYEEKYWSKDTAFDWQQSVPANLKEHLESSPPDEYQRIASLALPLVDQALGYRIEEIRLAGLPGVGYQTAEGDSIRIEMMFHNPTHRDYLETYVEVTIEYRRELASEAPLTNVYPAKFSVQGCAPSGYRLKAGENSKAWEFTIPYSGKLMQAGGHLHDHGVELRLENATRDEDIARLQPELDADGRLLHMPIVTFVDAGGYRLEAGDLVTVTARYKLATEQLPASAMGILVGLFVPDDETQLAALSRSGKN